MEENGQLLLWQFRLQQQPLEYQEPIPIFEIIQLDSIAIQTISMIMIVNQTNIYS